MMKRHFDEEMKILSVGIVNLSGCVEEILERAVESLEKMDIDLARSVIETEKKLDEIETDIERDFIAAGSRIKEDTHRVYEMETTLEKVCLKLLALYQPVAEDLRHIYSTMKIIQDLRRIAQLSVRVTEQTIQIAGQTLPGPMDKILIMASQARMILKESLDAFVNKDIRIARRVFLTEEKFNKMRDSISSELIELVKNEGTLITVVLPLIFITNYLERISDRCTSTSERIIFIVTGKSAMHDPNFIREIRQFSED